MAFACRKALSLAALCLSFFTLPHYGFAFDASTQKPLRTDEPSLPLRDAHHPLSLLESKVNSTSTSAGGWPVPPKLAHHIILFEALEKMQSHFFEVWLGRWPTSIDWTGAVLGTHVSATLASFANSNYYFDPSDPTHFTLEDENYINTFFSHIIAYYYGEDALALRAEAYDDMLWVVLGWLESIRFVQDHSDRHYRSRAEFRNGSSTWYATNFVPSFAHRARIFWELAATGWDEKLCGGGMVWNPDLAPYKNAITNELFVAASVGMYLWFPGDDNDYPFSQSQRISGQKAQKTFPKEVCSDTPCDKGSKVPGKPHDKQYLHSAISAYDWLYNANMRNDKGLFFDGYHISNRTSGQCDIPNHTLYTYNQGVILSGQRGLWEATGNRTYLEQGHELVRNTIQATGWQEANEFSRNPTFSSDNPSRPYKAWRAKSKDKWTFSGLGRAGILEDVCDASGTCNQNGQTFKGIFFHHLTAFCAPLPLRSSEDGIFHGADKFLASLHLASCKSYAAWVQHNAEAAMRTEDERGLVGGWWTVGLRDFEDAVAGGSVDGDVVDGEGKGGDGVDHWNQGVPRDTLWRGKGHWKEDVGRLDFWEGRHGFGGNGQASEKGNWEVVGKSGNSGGVKEERTNTPRDPNERGRGRTVETQSGGVAVLRAFDLFDGLVGGEGMKE